MSAHRAKATTQRIYVKVNSDFDATGAVTPRVIIWGDGRSFTIDAVRVMRETDLHGLKDSIFQSTIIASTHRLQEIPL